jgi:hypothetical protein
MVSKIALNMWIEKIILWNSNCAPIHRKKSRNGMPFTARGNAMIPERSACVPPAHVEVHTCRKSEKHCSRLWLSSAYVTWS